MCNMQRLEVMKQALAQQKKEFETPEGATKARERLQKTGILDKNGDITPRYSSIFVRK